MMRSGHAMGLRAAAAAVAAAAAMAVGCASMAPTAERWEPPPIGARFKEARVNTGSFGQGASELEYVRQERVSGGRPFVAFVSRQGTSLFTPDGAWEGVYLPQDGRPLVKWDPPLGYDWPLEVGKAFTQSFRLILAPDRAIPVTRTCKVEAHEVVNVPAGAFKAFKVVCSNTIGDAVVDWFSPELGVNVKRSLKRAEGHPFKAGTQEIELVAASRR